MLTESLDTSDHSADKKEPMKNKYENLETLDALQTKNALSTEAVQTDSEVLAFVRRHRLMVLPDDVSPDLLLVARLASYEKLTGKYGFGLEVLPKAHIRKKRSRDVRRGAKIHAYVGLNGGGKSLAMINDTLPTLNGLRWKCTEPEHLHSRKGIYEGYQKVLSTVKIVDPRNGRAHPLWIPYDDHRRLLSVEHADILMDEITGVAAARESLSMPVQVGNLLTQLRRRDCPLRWTTPNWANADKIIRQTTTVVTYCKGYFPVMEAGRSWPSKMMFQWKTYDAGSFESFNIGTRERVVPATFEFFSRLAKHNVAQEFYQTLAEVLTTKSTNDSGMCIHCSGKRTIPSCRCDRDEVDAPENLLRLGAEFSTNDFFNETEHVHAESSDAPKNEVFDFPY